MRQYILFVRLTVKRSHARYIVHMQSFHWYLIIWVHDGTPYIGMAQTQRMANLMHSDREEVCDVSVLFGNRFGAVAPQLVVIEVNGSMWRRKRVCHHASLTIEWVPQK